MRVKVLSRGLFIGGNDELTREVRRGLNLIIPPPRTSCVFDCVRLLLRVQWLRSNANGLDRSGAGRAMLSWSKPHHASDCINHAACRP